METYISTDIESDGPIPGPFSMLSFASVAYDENGKELGSFFRNLDLLPGAKQHYDTMGFWAKNQDAYNATRLDTMDPLQAMDEYRVWLRKYPSPVFVGYPAGFDFTWVYWYLINFGDESPFSFSALDIKTAVMFTLGTDYRKSTKKHMPKSWFDKKLDHTHVALDDAREQGHLFFSVLRDNKNLR